MRSLAWLQKFHLHNATSRGRETVMFSELCRLSSCRITVDTPSRKITIVQQQQQQQQRQRALSTLRRKRKKYEKYDSPQMGTQLLIMAGRETPFEYSGKTIQEYSEKASLSPWTPVPDSVARKIFEWADPTEEDVHVELGSGDGRVNFFAIEVGVKKSVGIDVDEDIVKIANDRLNRIHPKPSIEFMVADLMDPEHLAWKHVEESTILTMYFAKDGLEKIRPLIENALQGRRCKVFTCGYPMPGWESQIIETVLDMPIHFYDWGNTDLEDAILTDSFVDSMPLNMQAQGMDTFLKKKNSTFKPDPLKGFDPAEMIDFHWDDFESSDDQSGVSTNDNPTVDIRNK